MRARARSSRRNAHIRSSTVIYVTKLRQQEPRLKNLSRNMYIFGTEILFIRLNSFFILSMLSMRIQLFNSVNNSECMKQHNTPPPPPLIQCDNCWFFVNLDFLLFSHTVFAPIDLLLNRFTNSVYEWVSESTYHSKTLIHLWVSNLIIHSTNSLIQILYVSYWIIEIFYL